MNELQRTADLCTSAQIAIYPIAAAGLANDSAVTANATMPTMENMGMSPNPGQIYTGMVARQNSMELLAKTTGGKAFFNSNGIKDVS